jgi:hypothetical protein
MTLDELARLDTFQEETFDLMEAEDPKNWISLSDVVRVFVNNQSKHKTRDEIIRFLAILKKNLGYSRLRLCGSPLWFPYTLGNHMAFSKFMREMSNEFLNNLGKLRY